jgi:ubiquinone/menaquinone biosynthesis C-methylase UbiE
VSEDHGALDPKKEFYSLFRPGNLFLWQQRERALLRALRWAGVNRATIEHLRVLEVGCGAGGLLPQLVAYGATPRLLVGLDRDRGRIREASGRFPGMHFTVGDATALPVGSGRFDVVIQSTLFTSLLDPAVRVRAAREMRRVLHPAGFILWLDFRYDSPSNRQVRGVPRREIERDLFPGSATRFYTTMLVPPLARRIVPAAPFLAAALSLIPPLRTHYCAVIRPGA